jgi:hypothetical protein
MFLGHFAFGMLASRHEPRLPLGLAFVAAQLPDVLWPAMLLAGVERVTIEPGITAVTPLRFDHYPWSHSLLMVAVWGVALTAVSLALRLPKSATLLLLPLALSHWLLDFVSHRPDMPLLPSGGPHLGLELWSSLPLTLVVEGTLFAAAVVLFARRRTVGKAFWGLVAFLVVAYASALFGPPPPSVTALAATMMPVGPLLWWWGNVAGRAR